MFEYRYFLTYTTYQEINDDLSVTLCMCLRNTTTETDVCIYTFDKVYVQLGKLVSS